MIDFWESIGRLATYPHLNDGFLNVLPPAGPIAHVSVQVKRLNTTSAGLDIPQDQYGTVQKFLDPVLAENYLSLMAAGDLIMAYSFQESRDAMKQLEDVVSQSTPELFCSSTRYFITLGAVIIDNLFRHHLQKQKAEARHFLRRLAASEIDRIMNLIDNQTFEDAATRFCALPWAGGCSELLVYWEGYLQPIAVSTSAWTDPNNWTGDSPGVGPTPGYRN